LLGAGVASTSKWPNVDTGWRGCQPSPDRALTRHTPLGGRNTAAMADAADYDTNAVTRTVETAAPTPRGRVLCGPSTQGVDSASPPSTSAYRGLRFASSYGMPVLHLDPRGHCGSRPYSPAGALLTRPLGAVATCAPARRSVRQVCRPAARSPLRVAPTRGAVNGSRCRDCHDRPPDVAGRLTTRRGPRRHTVTRLRRDSAWRARASTYERWPLSLPPWLCCSSPPRLRGLPGSTRVSHWNGGA